MKFYYKSTKNKILVVLYLILDITCSTGSFSLFYYIFIIQCHYILLYMRNKLYCIYNNLLYKIEHISST